MGSTCGLISSDEKDEKDNISLPRRSTIQDSSTLLTSFCLTSDQSRIIRETWHNIKDKNEFAIVLFLRIFQISPEVVEVFGLEDSAANNSMRSAPRFLGHAANFSAFLNMIINHINGNETVAIKVCKVVGREHLRFSKRGKHHFHPKFWQTMLQALLIEMEIEQKLHHESGKYDQKFVDATHSAWLDLFGKVVDIMEMAYNKEMSQV